MAEIRPGRWTAEIEGDFVVFLIGARLDWRNPIRSARDLGGRRSLGYMLEQLSAQPEKGLLGHEGSATLSVQYWRSFKHLEAFANSKDDPHAQAWRTYWQRVGKSARTGIWHETYLVRAGEYETVYGNMPPFGLGKAAGRCRSPGRRVLPGDSIPRASDSIHPTPPPSVCTTPPAPHLGVIGDK